MKLFVLNSKLSDSNGYIYQALVRALGRRIDIQLHVISCSELRQIPVDPSNQALLVYGGEELHQIPSEYLQRAFGRRAIWFTEDPYELKRNIVSADLFQVVFTNDSGSLNVYRGGLHLPLAADPALVPQVPVCDPENLLFFSGTAWPNRKKLLSKLLTSWPTPDDFDLHLVANPFVENQFSSQRLRQSQNFRFEESIAISEFCLRSANSLCTLVVGRDFSGSGDHCYARSPGPRLFESGITGSCQLVHASEIPDMPFGLKEGHHFLRFKTTEQLIDLLCDAKTNPEPFRVIGSALSSEIHLRHTYDNRASVIVKSLYQCIPESAPYIQSYSKVRVLFISHEQTKPGFQYGGAGLCLDQIVAASPDDVDVRILCRSGDDGHSFIIHDRHGELVGGFRCHQKVSQFSLHHPELEHHIQKVLEDWKPQLVHVNHLLGFTPGILSTARNAGARIVITLHDYYAICDSWNLLDNDHKFCSIKTFFDDRCVSCCANRLPQFSFVDPFRRRIVFSEALARVQAVIVPSQAAKQQLLSIFPHLPDTHVISPVVNELTCQINCSEGSELVVLVLGNLAINKGYLELHSIIEQINDYGLPVQFRVLGRVEAWIQQELSSMDNVQLLGQYDHLSFLSKAKGADLALFLSPWPETYCISFDEWKRSGRPCFYYKIGALAEEHRQKGLHQASLGFEVNDRDGIMKALIKSTTPAGLLSLRKPNTENQEPSPLYDFGDQHWSLFDRVLNKSLEISQIHAKQHPEQLWVNEHMSISDTGLRHKIKNLIYRLPAGYRLVSVFRRLIAR